MNQKKTMKLWQMIVIVVLSVAMFVTMFLPAFHINGRAFGKMFNKVFSSSEFKEMAGEYGEVFSLGILQDTVKQEIDKQASKFDEEIKSAEEEEGIKISSIAPGRIMTHSFKGFFGEEVAEDDSEATAAMKSGYTMLRVMLWILYMLIIVVLVVVILGFCLKWTKYIALVVSTVYGLAATVTFGIFQFLLPGMLAKKLANTEIFGEMIGELTGVNGLEGVLSSLMPKMISCFWGVAFLVGFIIGLLLMIVSVVSMFVGKAAIAVIDSPEPIDNWEQKERERLERERRERERQAELERMRREQELERKRQEQLEEERRKKEQAAAAMGQVMCTKGAAAGKGFSLPEDRKVVVGKSSQNANLVINDPHISNVHCSIRYKAATRSYIVKDHSTNGTFVNGVRMQKGVATELPAGTVLRLADGHNEITLG